ncbi:MAG: glucuronate isomerase [Chitinophagales bacterium]
MRTTTKPFLGEHFLLENETAEHLYHVYAKPMPIIDYHCHLPPDQLASNHQFSNLTKVWLDGDHYKWRAMRTLGVDEKYITGDANDFEKFQKWAESVPFTIRNPLFHWTHLELKNYFDVDELLTSKSAASIYEHCTALLQTPEYSTQGLARKMNVDVICTTDDPLDNLEHHRNLSQQTFSTKVLPAFRPDKAILIESENFVDYIQKLGKVAGCSIENFDDVLQALQNRVDFFHENGCRLSDHGLEQTYASDFSQHDLSTILRKRIKGEKLHQEEIDAYRSATLFHLGRMYADKNWVMQLHLGALRNNSSRMKRILGPDTGFDSIGDWFQASALSRFLNHLDEEDKLPKTILYNLNPRDNEVMATMIGNFNDGSVRGKMQFGSAWWFLDQKDGMEKQINALSNMGMLSCFIGMLTDSRSFLSYPRHEYFRRLLCNIIGKDVHNGELPNDVEWLGGIIQDICYNNAKTYFDF